MKWSRACGEYTADPTAFVFDDGRPAPYEPAALVIEPQVFAIEYIDAEGEGSTRRIRCQRLYLTGGGYGMLQAYCFWRRAPRSFYVDRIKSVIDVDGVVYEPPGDFLTELATQHAIGSQAPAAKSTAGFSRTFRPELVLASAVAFADEVRHETEAEAIRDFVAQLALRHDFIFTPEELARAQRSALRLRPSAGDVEWATEKLGEIGERRVRHLASACTAIAMADGKLDAEEVALISELSREFGLTS